MLLLGKEKKVFFWLHLFFFGTVAVDRKHWYSACNTARPMLYTHQFHACRMGCSAPALCTFQQRISTLLQTLLESSGGAFAKGKMRTKSLSLSSHSLPDSLPNCTKTVILCVNKTCLFVYFWTVELQNSAKYIPDLWEPKHKCSHFSPSAISFNKLPLLSHPFISLRLHCCLKVMKCSKYGKVNLFWRNREQKLERPFICQSLITLTPWISFPDLPLSIILWHWVRLSRALLHFMRPCPIFRCWVAMGNSQHPRYGGLCSHNEAWEQHALKQEPQSAVCWASQGKCQKHGYVSILCLSRTQMPSAVFRKVLSLPKPAKGFSAV